MNDLLKKWKEENFWRTYRSIWEDLDDWDSWGEVPQEEEDDERDYMGRRKNTKWDRRDKKRHKAQYGMKESGRSVKFLERILNGKLTKTKS